MAGRIPQNFIDDLISRSDIVEVINARVPLKRKGKEYTACCPFHNEKTPSFTVSESKQFFYCFGCHAKGNVIGFLMDYEHLSYVEAIEALAADAHLEVPHESDNFAARKTEDKQPLYEVLQQAGKLYQQQLKTSQRAIDYLKQRGLSGEVAKHFGIGYAPDSWNFLSEQPGQSAKALAALENTGLVIRKDNNKTYDRFRDRIIFPIRDQRGRVIGFGGRVLDKGEPKYLNSPENAVFHKGYELYGLYEIKQALRKIERIIVVEGYMDVVALTQHGINYAVASLGTATTTDQIQKIFRSTQEIVYCYDGDTAGKQAAWRALENTLPVIRDGMIVKFLFLPEKEDPDTMIRKEGREAFEARIKNATALSDFLFDTLKSAADITTREGKAQLANRAKSLLEKMHNSLFKDLLIEELSAIVGLSHDFLESRISISENKNKPPQKNKTDSDPQLSSKITRLAVALLVQNPGLASHCKIPESFRNSANQGLVVLYELQQTIDTNPEMTSAVLLERYRNTRHENTLNTLSVLQSPETENRENMIEEYRNIIDRLDTENRYARLTQLTRQVENGEPLNDAETKEFSELISKKH